VGLEESVRRVVVKVKWNEPGRPEQSFEVVNFMTDPSKLDMALTGGSAAASAAGGKGTTPATGSTGTAGTGSSGINLKPFGK
jgi:hypothetical protein